MKKKKQKATRTIRVEGEYYIRIYSKSWSEAKVTVSWKRRVILTYDWYDNYLYNRTPESYARKFIKEHVLKRRLYGDDFEDTHIIAVVDSNGIVTHRFENKTGQEFPHKPSEEVKEKSKDNFKLFLDAATKLFGGGTKESAVSLITGKSKKDE